MNNAQPKECSGPVVIGDAVLHIGDCLDVMCDLPDGLAQCCVTSPPYFGLRDYGCDGQIGLEATPTEYVDRLVDVFSEVWRVLADDVVLWLNLGDSYAATTKGSGGTAKGTIAGGKGRATNQGSFYAAKFDLKAAALKPKDLIGIPWRVAFALQEAGWYLRQDIIWHKPNPMPESVRDRCTKAHEYLFMLSKSPRYYWDADAIKEPVLHPNIVRKSGAKTPKQNAAFFHKAPTNLGRCGTNEEGTRNRRSVWTITPKPYKGAHFAVMPEALAEPCILAGSRPGDVVLDPFTGSGTTAAVALSRGRQFVGSELNPDYLPLICERIESVQRTQDSEPSKTTAPGQACFAL